MQILAIRGANLASLADTFEIDLTEEPLASAGLFAITGETGAGKSTILDAMCLALYGSCPRLSGAGVNDDVPDIAGEAIKSSDPRAILRRGASQAHAEVDFLAPNGLRYRASWTARRARGRAEGRLQNVDRALIDLASGAVMESQINAVREQVTVLTGLTYDEFRRTVLLAQGDFDAFLRANTAERAALLEKVTGTEIYRAISRRIYARHEEARSALETLQIRRSATSALPDEERQALGSEQSGLTEEGADLDQRIDALAKNVAAFERVKAGEAQLARARTDLDAAEAAQTSAEGDRSRLGALETALSLRTEHQRLISAKAVQDKFLMDRDALTGARTAKSQEVTSAGTRAAAARQAMETTEETFKAFGPQWTEATRLDGLIKSAGQEVETARSRLTAAEEKRDGAERNLNGEIEAEQAARTDHEAALAQLTRAAGAEDLATRWDDLYPLMDERGTLRQRQADLRKDREVQLKIKLDGEKDLEALTAEDTKDVSRIREIEAKLAASETRRDEIMKDDPRKRLEKLSTGRQHVIDMARHTGTVDQEAEVTRTARAEIARQTQISGAARTSQEEASAKATRAEAAIQALLAPVDQAEAAASDVAARLRGTLSPGCPCPVCGSKDHPVAADDALLAIARDMRARLDAERATLAEATKDRAAADRARDAAELACRTQSGLVDASETRMSEACSSFSDSRAQAEALGLTGLPQAAAGAGPSLKDLLGRLEGRKREIDTLIRELDDLTEQVSRDGKTMSSIRQGLDARSATRDQLKARLDAADRKIGLADQEVQQIDTRIDRIDRSLEGSLSGVRVTPSGLDGNPVELRGKLERIVTAWRGECAKRDKADTILRASAPKISSARATLDACKADVVSLASALSEREAGLRDLTGQRGALLEGEETESHRSRHNALRLSAQEAHQAQSETLSRVTSELSALDARLGDLLKTETPIGAELDAAKGDLTEKLATVGLSLEALPKLIADAARDLTGLRERLRKIDEAVIAGKSALAARAADLEGLRKSLPAEGSEADLRAALETSRKRRDDIRERLGAVAEILKADDALRDTLKGLDAEIAAAKDVRDTWSAVNEAVGSRQGGKFAQIAQSVTLSLLVDRANAHLADLKPRYRLAQGGEDLSLHIIDRDMGDEIRSTRSLSGGERFLVSLALALALSSLGGQGGLAATLFIDEGFGSLDADSLDLAMDALDSLQAQGRTVGVISHVDAMKERIPVQIRVTRRGAGASSVRLASVAG